MDALTLSSPVTCLSGIKTARAAQLQKLGIRTLYDLIAYFPRDYEDRTRIAEIGSLGRAFPPALRPWSSPRRKPPTSARASRSRG